jgi:hypothetical protein
LNFNLSNNWGGSVSYGFIALKAKNLPSVYNSETCPNGNCRGPSDYLTTRSLRIVKVYPTSEKILRFGIEGGFSLIEYKETQFHKSNYNPRTYTSSNTTRKSIGLSLQAKMEFPVTKLAGFEFSVLSNINALRTFVGVQLHFTIGVIR